jgi:ferredoxin
MKILKDKCIGCGMCLDECPLGAIKIENIDLKISSQPYVPCYIDSKLCENCGACKLEFSCVTDSIVEDE